MVEIEPLRGVRYNQTKLKSINLELEDVISLPYDVIDEPYGCGLNISYIDKGWTTPSDNKFYNKYTRSFRLLTNFLADGTFMMDKEPSIYVYEQEFSINNQRKKRRGFVALIKVEDYGKVIFPHEDTIPEQVEDRLEMLRKCEANFNPIFALYEGSPISQFLEVDSEPIIDVTFDGVVNRIWTISDKGLIEKGKEKMRSRRVIIADGHHRYEAARLFKKEYPYALMYFNHIGDEGLTIFDTHLRSVSKGKVELNPKFVKSEEIEAVAFAGKIFKEKATYFYPKLLSGLVMYKFE